MFYTIYNNGIITANNREALTRFYNNVQVLPEDYEEGKYIVVTKQEEYEVTDYDIETGEPTGTHIEVRVYQTLDLNPDYEAEQAQKEAERVARLSCTKRDFALMLQELGVDYFTQLKPLIESNPQAQLEWELCERLYRFNPMLDLMAGQLGVTPEQLDGLFKYANGEITIDEFRGLIPPVVEDETIEEELTEVEND